MGQRLPAYFDYHAVARECRLGPEQMEALEAVERAEFPEDQMMFELHMLRILEQIRAGRTKLEDVLPTPR